MSFEWYCKIQDGSNVYKQFLPGVSLLGNDHPLSSVLKLLEQKRGTIVDNKMKEVKEEKRKESIPTAYLTLEIDGTDPLSMFARQSVKSPLDWSDEIDTNTPRKNTPATKSLLKECSTAWQNQRTIILSKYTTNEKLSIASSYLSGGEIIKPQSATIYDQVKYRLEQLDDFEEDSIRQMMGLNQQEYIMRIEQLNYELVQAWNSDQRVKALKIAIQCSKLLSDTSVMQFYPSQFVLITDILDIFGNLVYDRLHNKANQNEFGVEVTSALPEHFTPDMVSNSAKETCQNWFYKIASIRELLPRIYCEISVLRAYSFIHKNQFEVELTRLTKSIRGIGDPLVAAYARCYLCRIGMTISMDINYIRDNLYDILAIYHTLFKVGVRSEITRQRLDFSNYLALYTPAIDWLIHSMVSHTTNDQFMNEFLEKSRQERHNGVLLMSIINSFKIEFISEKSIQLVNIIADCSTEGVSKGQLFRTLGTKVIKSPPPSDVRLQLLINVSKIFSTLTNPSEYLSCIEPWIQYTGLHFGIDETEKFLIEILNRMNKNRIYEEHYHDLHQISDKIVMHTKDLEGLLIMNTFLQFIDLFKKESIKTSICKYILSEYMRKSDRNISDPVLKNSLIHICKTLNDSVNALTVEDERRQIGNLICQFIKRIDYGMEFEEQLTFFVDARAIFCNLDQIFVTLVLSVNKLAVDVRKIINGQHSKKTLAFVKACVAYCFITIPSIISISTQMNLYLLTGQVALLNTCLGQADACFDASINLIPELHNMISVDCNAKTLETYLISFIPNILSTLIVVPDSPEQGVLYLTRKLLETIKNYPFEGHTLNRSTLLLKFLDMLIVSAQETYPYHIAHVVSNDDLYGSDTKYISEINLICTQILELLLVQLRMYGEQGQTRLESSLALELFNKVVYSTDLSYEKGHTLAANLWTIAFKNKSSVDPQLPGSILMQVESLKTRTHKQKERYALEELTKRMRIKISSSSIPFTPRGSIGASIWDSLLEGV